MRRGVVLLITISFITIIAGLIGAYFKLSDDTIKRNSRKGILVQTNLFMKDLKEKVLPSLDDTIEAIFKANDIVLDTSGADKDRIKLNMYNQFFYGIPLPMISDSAFGDGVLTCYPGNKRLNINIFKDLNDTYRPIFRDKFNLYLQEKEEVVRPDVLSDLIYYVLNIGDVSYYETDKSLKVNQDDFQKGEIRNKVDFEKILQDYVTSTDDKKVLSIDWDNLFEFYGDGVDFNQMTPEMCNLLFRQTSAIDEEFCVGFPKDKTETEIVEATGGEVVIKALKMSFDFNPRLDCKVNYEKNGVKTEFSFLYDSKTLKSADTNSSDSNRTSSSSSSQSSIPSSAKPGGSISRYKIYF